MKDLNDAIESILFWPVMIMLGVALAARLFLVAPRQSQGL